MYKRIFYGILKYILNICFSFIFFYYIICMLCYKDTHKKKEGSKKIDGVWYKTTSVDSMWKTNVK